MAKLNGTLNAILSGTDKLMHISNATLDVNVNLPEASTKESEGWEAHIHGIRDWSISFDGKYDEVKGANQLNPVDILDAIIARSADTVIKFALDGIIGNKGWTGNGTYQNISFGADMEVPVTFSGTIKGNGPLAKIA